MAVTFRKATTLEDLVSEVQTLQTFVMALTDEVAALRQLLEESED